MNETISQKVRGIREAKGLERRGWSQEQLAQKAVLSKGTVNQIEGGIILNPGVSTMRKLAEALEVRLEWLIDGELDDGESWHLRASSEALNIFAVKYGLNDGDLEPLRDVARTSRGYLTVNEWLNFWLNYPNLTETMRRKLNAPATRPRIRRLP